jgi:glycosyltransferase involved in cell wall biosynthesis
MPAKVTIVIPTVGRPDFFPLAVSSAAAQTYNDLEILVSDNKAIPPILASDVERFAAGRKVRLVRQEARLGFGEHFNACLEAAQGEFVMFLSDDDLLAPGFLDASVKAFDAGPDVMVALGKQHRIDEAFRGTAPDEPLSFELQPGRDFVARWHCDGDPQGIMTTVSMMARRKDMLAAGGFGIYPSGGHSDIILFLRLALKGRIALLSGGFHYRVYSQSTGLGMPWGDLIESTRLYEADLGRMRAEGTLDPTLYRGMIRAHTRLLLHRWKRYYRERAAWYDGPVQLAGIAGRVVAQFLRHGPAATPGLPR